MNPAELFVNQSRAPKWVNLISRLAQPRTVGGCSRGASRWCALGASPLPCDVADCAREAALLLGFREDGLDELGASRLSSDGTRADARFRSSNERC